MNPNLNFDIKNPRDYPDYDNVPAPMGTLSTSQRMMKSFNAKVFFWAALAIFDTWALFENPLFASASNNLTEIRLLFVAGLVLGACQGIAWQKRKEANMAPRWQRIALGIITLATLFVVFRYLGNNSYILALCQGGVAGAGAWYAIATYRSNWATYI
jgi:FtsH-binding integral membrane protein